MGAPLSSHWPMSRHGPGGDVLGHLGPAFLLTVTSHWPEKQKHRYLALIHQFCCIKSFLFIHFCPHIVIILQNYDGSISGIYQADINHSSVVVFMSALNVHMKGVHIITVIRP